MQCKAYTIQGYRCSCTAKYGNYCGHHRNGNRHSKQTMGGPKLCKAYTTKGYPCSFSGKYNGYCGWHYKNNSKNNTKNNNSSHTTKNVNVYNYGNNNKTYIN